MLSFISMSCNQVNNDVLGIIHQYYPRGLTFGDPSFVSSPEYKKLKYILDNRPYENESMALLEDLKSSYGIDNIFNMSGPTLGNPCYHFRADIFKTQHDSDLYIIFISQISEYYYIYVNDDLWQESLSSTDESYKEVEKKF